MVKMPCQCLGRLCEWDIKLGIVSRSVEPVRIRERHNDGPSSICVAETNDMDLLAGLVALQIKATEIRSARLLVVLLLLLVGSLARPSQEREKPRNKVGNWHLCFRAKQHKEQ